MKVFFEYYLLFSKFVEFSSRQSIYIDTPYVIIEVTKLGPVRGKVDQGVFDRFLSQRVPRHLQLVSGTALFLRRLPQQDRRQRRPFAKYFRFRAVGIVHVIYRVEDIQRRQRQRVMLWLLEIWHALTLNHLLLLQPRPCRISIAALTGLVLLDPLLAVGIPVSEMGCSSLLSGPRHHWLHTTSIFTALWKNSLFYLVAILRKKRLFGFVVIFLGGWWALGGLGREVDEVLLLVVDGYQQIIALFSTRTTATCITTTTFNTSSSSRLWLHHQPLPFLDLREPLQILLHLFLCLRPRLVIFNRRQANALSCTRASATAAGDAAHVPELFQLTISEL